MFKFGLEDGISVRYYADGVLSDSIIYKRGSKNGFSFKYDHSGRLSYKIYNYNDRSLGHVYTYSPTGDLKSYQFFDFEGNLIYQSYRKDSSTYEKGNLINVRLNNVIEEGVEKKVLFMFLLSPPDLKIDYEIAILNSKRQIISSKRIVGECFYEESLDVLPTGKSYAVVLHIFNPYKKRDDLQIAVLEPDIIYGFENL